MNQINFDRERGVKLLTVMERIRAFEESAVLAAERDKLVLGAIHPSSAKSSGGRRDVAAQDRRLLDFNAPGPWSHTGQGCRSNRYDARAFGPRRRLLWRQGRIHAYS